MSENEERRRQGLEALEAVPMNDAWPLFRGLQEETRTELRDILGSSDQDVAAIWWQISQAKSDRHGSLRGKPVKDAVDKTRVLVRLDTREGRPPAETVTAQLLKVAGEVYGFCTKRSSQIGNSDPYCGVELRREAVEGSLRLQLRCLARGAHRDELGRHDRNQALDEAERALQKAFEGQTHADSNSSLRFIIGSLRDQIVNTRLLVDEIDPRES